MTAELTQYGFNFGAAIVERMCCDDKKGWVVVGVRTEGKKGKRKEDVQVTVMKGGKIRVASAKGEWKLVEKAGKK